MCNIFSYCYTVVAFYAGCFFYPFFAFLFFFSSFLLLNEVSNGVERRVDGPYFSCTGALRGTECFRWWPAILLHLVPPDLAPFLSIPGSLVADWCVILISSFCAASESISANGWSAVGGGSTEGSPSLSPEPPPPLTAHFPAPLRGVVFIRNVLITRWW